MEFKEIFNFSRLKIVLLCTYLIVYLFVWSTYFYNSYLNAGVGCQLEGGCSNPQISYLEYLFQGTFFTSTLFSNIFFFLGSTIIFLVIMHTLNSFIQYTYYKKKSK